MTGKDWQRSTDVRRMLLFVFGRMSERKRLLYVAGCCRALEAQLDDDSRKVVELAEEFADGRGDRDTLHRSAQLAETRARATFLQTGAVLTAARVVACVVGAAHVAGNLLRAATYTAEMEPDTPAPLLRDLVGNPYRNTALDPTWLSWNAGAIEKLARVIYDDRRFDDLPLLADALAEAGCCESEILDHLRGPGRHARGCWVLDLLLRLR